MSTPAAKTRARRSVLVLHGPSLTLLGTRETAIYGTTTFKQLNASLTAEARVLGLALRVVQSNHEGALIDAIVAAPGSHAGILINAGAYAHTSLAIADAIRAVALPAVEVHLSNTVAREPARHPAVVGAACAGRVEGFGAASYLWGLRALAGLLVGS